MISRDAASVAELRALAAAVADALGVDVDAILASGSEREAYAEQRIRALRVAAYIGVEHLHRRPREVVEHFGGRSTAEIRSAVSAMRNDLIMHPGLGETVNHISKTWYARLLRSGRDALLDAAVEAVERALEAGLASDLRVRMLPLLWASEEDL